jgi:multicomponent K+:H+ antiporter subunit E
MCAARCANAEPKAVNHEPKAANHEPQAANHEPTAANHERRRPRMSTGTNIREPHRARRVRDMRLWPAPGISLVLWLMWPVLNQSWSLGQLLLGALLAWAIPLFVEPLRRAHPRPGAPRAALRLAMVVSRDIVTSNLEVARLILGPEARIRPRFVWLPLSITEPHGIVALAAVITLTPGTLAADLTADRAHLLIHAFNVDDEAALVASIKARYEAPLMEIFGR